MLSLQQIRTTIRCRRQQLSHNEQQYAAQCLVQQIQHLPRLLAAQHIALFLSFDGEINTHPLIQYLWQQNKKVYLPVLHPFSPGYLLFLRYTPTTPMVTNRYNIKEPRLDIQQVLPLKQLDVIFTPLVAFDTRGHRLGMGGGYYDRTLQQWPEAGPYPIGLAHDCQQVATLPTKHWDVPLPTIITPSKIWYWDNKQRYCGSE